MKLPEEIRRRFRAYGAEGGRARARALSSDTRRRIARRGAVTRWTRERFGVARFAELGLPGADIVDTGIDDLIAGRESVASLVVCLAAPRLRWEGVPVPVTDVDDPDMRLYRLLEQTEGDLAHARYLAHRRQVQAFADACRMARVDRRSA